MNQKDKLFQEQYMREAFSHAIHFKKMNDVVLKGDYKRLEHTITGYGDYSNNAVKARTFDIKKVEEIMTKNGWKKNKDLIWAKGKDKFEVEVIYSFDGHSPRLVVFKEEAMKAGIKLNLKLLDGTTTYKKVMEKNHQVVWWGWGTSGLTPQPWQSWHSDNADKPQTNNITNTKDKEIDKLINAYDNSSDLKERQGLIKKLTQRIHDLALFVPIYQVPYYRAGYWRWWKGPERKGTPLTDMYMFIGDAMSTTTGGLFWFDKKVYDETQKAMKAGKAFEPVTIIDKTYAPK